MKGKILGFFCSLILLAASSKGQTVDGVLYTNFNNYYKWRGGAFDSTLLLPTIAASIGRRPGALRYSTADSSVYSWTGFQWRKVTGGEGVFYVDSVYVSNDTLRYRKNNVIFNGGSIDTATVVKAFVHNAESVTINRGQVVYIDGASGDKASVRLASNLNDSLSARTFGFVRENIAAGQDGWVVTQGQITGINLGAYAEGDILWLDSIAGGFTKIRPEAPKHGVFLGVVERANPGNGIIYVKVQNGQEISELHDVKITSPKTGDAITYTPSSQIWENRQVVLKQDTVPLAVFNVGSAAAGDTAAFSTSTLAGSFYLDGTDTMFITSYRVALQGTSAEITPDVWFNDSLNVTAGGTKLVNSPSAITNLTTGTSVTPDTNKIPPGNFVFVRFSAVTTKPTYFTLTLFGYRIRKQ